jgi:hypothetical protein
MHQRLIDIDGRSHGCCKTTLSFRRRQAALDALPICRIDILEVEGDLAD